jgi:hypothetical protein
LQFGRARGRKTLFRRKPWVSVTLASKMPIVNREITALQKKPRLMSPGNAAKAHFQFIGTCLVKGESDQREPASDRGLQFQMVIGIAARNRSRSKKIDR